MNDIVALTNHAASQSDRWLFICSLIILGLFALLIWRWIVRDRDKLANRLTEITDKHIVMCEKLSEVVANNTTVMREATDIMNRCRDKR